MAPKPPSKTTGKITSIGKSSCVATMFSRAPKGPSKIDLTHQGEESTEMTASHETSSTPQLEGTGGFATASTPPGSSKETPVTKPLDLICNS